MQDVTVKKELEDAGGDMHGEKGQRKSAPAAGELGLPQAGCKQGQSAK